MSKQKGNMMWLIIILGFMLFGSGTLTGLRALTSYPAYTTGYQGAHARFYGVREGGKTYKQGLWDTTFKWDKPNTGDHWQDDVPNTPPIAGEMTSVFVPSESVGYQPDWILPEWLVGATKTRNPVETYEWELEDGEETVFYRMELWRLKWYFSISSKAKNDDDIPKGKYVDVLSNPRNSLKDTEVWFEFDLTPIWYFNGTDRAYFAIASLRLTDIEFGALEGGERNVDRDSRLVVTPQSKQSILPIYYRGFGGPRAEKEAYTYKGKELNPDLFTDRVYSYFTLNDFGVSCWWDWGWFWKTDVVTVGLDVDVFVIGEWKVKDVQDLPDEYGRTAQTGGQGFALGAFFGTAEGRFWILVIVAIVILLILALSGGLAGAMLLVSNMFRSRKSRTGG